MTKTNIIVKIQVEGFHCWENAAKFFPEVSFLSERHRHIFHITVKKEVSHSDRDIEIILFKRKITEYLYKNYGCGNDIDLYKWCEFKNLSCEMIAEILLKHFDLSYCSVIEDNENGSEVIKYEPDFRQIVFGGGDLQNLLNI